MKQAEAGNDGHWPVFIYKDLDLSATRGEGMGL